MKLKDISFTINGQDYLYPIENISYDDFFLHIESEDEITFVPLKDIEGIITVTKEEEYGTLDSSVSNIVPIN